MTRPVFEDGYSKEIGRSNYRTSQLERRPQTPSGGAVYQIKVKRDDVPLVVGDDGFVWFVPAAFDGAEVMLVEGAFSEAGAGADTQIAMRLSGPCATGSDILSSKLIIPSGDCNDDGTAVVVPNTLLATGQHLHIDVDQASGGLGFNIALTLLESTLSAVAFQGLRGPPGGVTQWTGQWQDVTAYTAGQAVASGGTSYAAIQDHTSSAANDEPGVGTNWQDFWQPLVVGHDPYSGIVTMILGNELPVDFGIKAAIPIPFDCEIVEATLLADQAGSCVVDFWKDSYGAYPPTIADSITAASPLTIVGSNKTTDVVLAGWDTTLVAGDVLMVVIASITSLYWLSVGLRVQRP